MSYIEPTREQMAALATEVARPGPVEMINLLRFRAEANYPAGSGHAACSGKEAYGRYGMAVLEFLEKVGGTVVWHGIPQMLFIGPDDRRWDEVLIVRYPDAAAFERMITDPGYLAIAVHRTAALEDSRLIVTRKPG